MEEKNEKQLKDELNKSVGLAELENYINNNEVEFEYENIRYKIKKPTYKQKLEANKEKIKKQLELLKAIDDKGEPVYILDKDWIELYKKRGIDIDKMDNTWKALQQQKNKYLLQLGEALKDKKSENELKTLKDEIIKINEEQQLITFKRAGLLDGSLETQLMVYVFSYLAHLVTEKFVDEKWIKAWSTYDEFLDSKDELINKLIMVSSLLVRNEDELV